MTEKDNANDKGGFGYPLLGDGWRDASKELPDDGVTVLDENCDKVHYYRKAHHRYSSDDCWFSVCDDGTIVATEVKAWRPLSDPPTFA